MLRFVVQCHNLPDGDQHWDLMLEGPRGLYTWSMPAPLDEAQALPMTVQQLADHRPMYLDYEGEISGGRGRVDIHDSGEYRWCSQEQSAGGLSGPPDSVGEATASPGNAGGLNGRGRGATFQPDIADELVFDLLGQRVSGRYRLSRETQSGKDIWRLSRVSG